MFSAVDFMERISPGSLRKAAFKVAPPFVAVADALRLFLRAVRTQSALAIVALVAAVVALARQLLLPVPELWGYGEEIGELLYDLSLATLAAWIFNLMVVSIPRLMERDRLAWAAQPYFSWLVLSSERLVVALADAADSSPGVFPSGDREELWVACNARSPEFQRLAVEVEQCGAGPKPDRMWWRGRWVLNWTEPVSWEEFIAAEAECLAIAYDRLRALYAHLPSEVIAALREHEGSSIHHAMRFAGQAGWLPRFAADLPLYEFECGLLRLALQELFDVPIDRVLR